MISPKSHVFTKFIDRVEMKPQDQKRVWLGEFTQNYPAKGFLIEFDNDVELHETVVAQVSALGSSKHYKLVLHIANYSDQSIGLNVWQM